MTATTRPPTPAEADADAPASEECAVPFDSFGAFARWGNANCLTPCAHRRQPCALLDALLIAAQFNGIIRRSLAARFGASFRVTHPVATDPTRRVLRADLPTACPFLSPDPSEPTP